MEIFLKTVLKREMKTRGVTINALAKECKIPVATLHGWIQGTLPSAKNIHHLQSLSKYFGITINEILFNSKNDSSESILFSSTFVDEENKYRLTIERLKK